MADWYYTKNGQQQGPVNDAELKRLASTGQLTPQDMIWKEGMANWLPATAIKGLFGAAASAPSGAQKPVPKPVEPAPAATGGEPEKTAAGGAPPRKNKGLVIGLIGGGVVLLFCCGCSGLFGVLWWSGVLGGGAESVPLDRKFTLAQGETKKISLRLEAGKKYVFEATSDDFLPVLFLEDPSGKSRSQDLESSLEGKARIVYSAPVSGTYLLSVSAADNPLRSKNSGTVRLTCKLK
jgi:hypothetical protein